MRDKEEYILCAANYYNDYEMHEHQPFNIGSGFVILGMRHHNCINTFAQIVGFPYTPEGLKIRGTEQQGFLTSKNRFVDRFEAGIIAYNAKQTETLINRLHSEDLY